MLGMDSIAPFVKVAKETGKGLFVLIRTSNPGSADFQDAKLQDGRTWSEALADRLQPEAEAPGLLGNSGWSNIGAVVGATQPHTIESFRARLPKSIFLLPGYGTQGATAGMTRAAFKDGEGGLVSASRSILYPKPSSADWRGAVSEAAKRMIAEVRSVLQT
jgi:orotidine-5'-phosphate decarboxylase